MIISETPLKGAYLVDIQKLGDERGFFGRSWCKNEMQAAGLDIDIAQINTSLSRFKGTLRGLHFQLAPYQESKLIRCTKGTVFDVIVDLRPESPTFLKWYGAELNEHNHRALYSPKGFAQGFITLEDDTEITYISSEFYAPGQDRGSDTMIRVSASRYQLSQPLSPKKTKAGPTSR